MERFAWSAEFHSSIAFGVGNFNVVALAVACRVSLFVHPLVDHPVSCRLQAVILWMSSLALECHGSWPPSIGICRQDGHEFASPQTKVPYQHVSNIISATLAEAGTKMPPQGTTFAVTSQGMSFSVLVWEPVQLELTVRFLQVLFVYHVSNRGEVFFFPHISFQLSKKNLWQNEYSGYPLFLAGHNPQHKYDDKQVYIQRRALRIVTTSKTRQGGIGIPST